MHKMLTYKSFYISRACSFILTTYFHTLVFCLLLFCCLVFSGFVWVLVLAFVSYFLESSNDSYSRIQEHTKHMIPFPKQGIMPKLIGWLSAGIVNLGGAPWREIPCLWFQNSSVWINKHSAQYCPQQGKTLQPSFRSKSYSNHWLICVL